MAAEVDCSGRCPRAICIRLAGDWTADDLVRAAETWHTMAAAATDEPVLVIDLSESHRMPDRLLARMADVTRYIPPGKYQTVIVGVHGAEARIVDHLIRSFFPSVVKKLSFQDTLETAEAYLVGERVGAVRSGR
ncbi:MAG: hypothetical protein AAF787_24175 [Chloroflexota bacterium]